MSEFRDKLKSAIAKRDALAAEISRLNAAYSASYAAIRDAEHALRDAKEASELAQESTVSRQTEAWASGTKLIANGLQASREGVSRASDHLQQANDARAAIRARLHEISDHKQVELLEMLVDNAVVAVIKDESQTLLPQLTDEVAELQTQLVEKGRLLQRLAPYGDDRTEAVAFRMRQLPQLWQTDDRRQIVSEREAFPSMRP